MYDNFVSFFPPYAFTFLADVTDIGPSSEKAMIVLLSESIKNENFFLAPVSKLLTKCGQISPKLCQQETYKTK